MQTACTHRRRVARKGEDTVKVQVSVREAHNVCVRGWGGVGVGVCEGGGVVQSATFCIR
jgi:hypothetical protein